MYMYIFTEAQSVISYISDIPNQKNPTLTPWQ